MGEDIVLSWDIKSLSVVNRKQFLFKKTVEERHTLLRNVHGYAKSGSLLAIMGPSGAGKTSLLATLSKRLSGEMNGEVLLNGRSADKDLMVKISGFVPQKDLAVTCLTVIEHLTFVASLKLDRRVSKSQQQIIIRSLMADLHLVPCMDTHISALSGGERKRLSLAAQMITDPLLLFCDEPTTGLDSYSACSVVNVLRALAARGKTVVCSIHQPSSEVFHLFDRLCLLIPGGGLAYHGTVKDAQQYFKSQGMVCPELYNPSDFFLSKLNCSSSVKEDLCQKFTESAVNATLLNELGNIKKSSTKHRFIFGMEEQFLVFYSMKPATQQMQIRWLLWRSTTAMIRDNQRLLLRLVMYLFVGLLVSTPFATVELDQNGIQNLQGFHYSIITETIFSHTYSVLHTFPAEIAVMLREINNGVYEPGPYYFSKAIILLPRVVVETALFCMVAFLIVGLEGGSLGFMMFSVPAIVSGITSTAYGCCISAMFENVSSASLLTVPVDVISYIFCGIFIQLSSLPFYLKWVKYISRFYYGIEAMSILQWRQVEDIPCSKNENIPCISSGKGVLAKYGFSSHHLPLDFLGLIVTFIVLHTIGFIALKRRSKRQSAY